MALVEVVLETALPPSHPDLDNVLLTFDPHDLPAPVGDGEASSASGSPAGR